MENIGKHKFISQIQFNFQFCKNFVSSQKQFLTSQLDQLEYFNLYKSRSRGYGRATLGGRIFRKIYIYIWRKSLKIYFSETNRPDKLQLVLKHLQVVWIQVCSKHDLWGQNEATMGPAIVNFYGGNKVDYSKKLSCYNIWYCMYLYFQDSILTFFDFRLTVAPGQFKFDSGLY